MTGDVTIDFLTSLRGDLAGSVCVRAGCAIVSSEV